MEVDREVKIYEETFNSEGCLVVLLKDLLWGKG